MELTCWWNQLWIIFMNMKSITAAAAINQFNHLFSLRMRKERLIGLICCVSGPFRNAKVNEVNFWWRKGGWASHSLSAIQIKIIFIWAAERRNERSEAGLFLSSALLSGLGAAAAATLRERERTKTRRTAPIQRERRLSSPTATLNEFMNEACGGGERRQTSGAPRGSRPAASPSTHSSFVGPLRAIKKMSWVEWKGCLALLPQRKHFSFAERESCGGKETNKLNSTSSIHWREWSGMSLVSFPLINSTAAKSNSINQPFFNWLIDWSCCCLLFFFSLSLAGPRPPPAAPPLN